MATAPVKKQAAMGALLETFGKIIDAGAAKMNKEQLRKSEAKFNQAVKRAVARPKQRRETA